MEVILHDNCHHFCCHFMEIHLIFSRATMTKSSSQYLIAFQAPVIIFLTGKCSINKIGRLFAVSRFFCNNSPRSVKRCFNSSFFFPMSFFDSVLEASKSSSSLLTRSSFLPVLLSPLSLSFSFNTAFVNAYNCSLEGLASMKELASGGALLTATFVSLFSSRWKSACIPFLCLQ